MFEKVFDFNHQIITVLFISDWHNDLLWIINFQELNKICLNLKEKQFWFGKKKKKKQKTQIKPVLGLDHIQSQLKNHIVSG